MSKNSKYFTVNQIAAYLEVSKQAVNNWINAGELKVYRLPSGRIKILKSDFLDYLKSNNLYVDQTIFGNGRHNVVVIDNDTKILNLYRKFFEKNRLNVRVDCVTDGITGLIKVGRSNADLVILDMDLEDINGIQICNKILDNKSLGDIKVVITTGYIKNFGHLLKKLSVETIIVKPLTIEVLEEKLLPIITGNQSD